MTDEAAAAAAAVAAAAAAAAAAKPWYDGQADAEMVGHWQNKGYDVTSPAKIAIEATKAHREAEKLVGAPASQLIRLPADPGKDPEGMRAVWQRLGAPKDAAEYDLPQLKDKDGKVTDAALDTTLRTAMAKVNLPKDMAGEITAAIVKHNTDVAVAKAAELEATLVTERETLRKNWGANEPANRVIATNAAKALGLTEVEINALEKTVGYARVMEMLRNIGTKIGEDKFIKGEGGETKIASRDQANARLTELKQDKAWVKRYNDGDTLAKREMHDLMVIITAGESEDRV